MRSAAWEYREGKQPQFESLNPGAETIAISATPVETDVELSGAGLQNKFTYVIEG